MGHRRWGLWPVGMALAALLATIEAACAQASLRLTPTTFEDELRVAIVKLMPSISVQSAAVRAEEYTRASENKAQAFSYEPAGTWRTINRPSEDLAADHALEGCQIVHDRPCALLAVGNRLREGPNGGRPAVRDMPRVRYTGPFDPAMVPTLTAPGGRDDVKAFIAHQGPKAAALHPTGRLFVSVDAPDQRSAEALALTACNADQARRGRDGLCYLYASGNQVVLSRRALGTITPAGK